MKLLSIENDREKIKEQSEIIRYYTKEINNYREKICEIKTDIRMVRIMIAQVDILNASIENGIVKGSNIEIIEPSQNMMELLEDVMSYHRDLKKNREYLREYIMKRVNVRNTKEKYEMCIQEKEKQNVGEVCKSENIHCEYLRSMICDYV